MTDAFDRWTEWSHNPPGERSGLPSDIYASVMKLPEADRADRQKVNAAAAHDAELRQSGRTAWLYLNNSEGRRSVGDPEWLLVFASAEAANRWFAKHDPEGVAWEYEIEGGHRQAVVWLCLADESSTDIGSHSWTRLFASKEAAEKWREQNAPEGKIWECQVRN